MSDVQNHELVKFVGETVTRVCRLRYQVGDRVTSRDDGSVELVFASGATLLCESGSDGDSLRVRDTAWVDPFAGPLSPENEEFVRTSGKWVRHDVSDEPPFHEMINQKIFDIAPMTGIRKDIRVAGELVRPLLAFYAIADELHVRSLY
jgi:hypothetical protein